MKKSSKNLKVLAFATAGSLTLLGGAFLSAAHADNAPAPTISTSTGVSVNPLDVQVNDETDSSAQVVNNEEAQNLINDQLSTDVTNNNDQSQNGDVNVQEGDAQIASLNSENQQEGDSFNQDINQANQDGNQEDAAALQTDATIVTGVVAPELQEISTDNTIADNLIVGAPTK